VQVMIRYKLKRDQVKRNLELLGAAFEELESAQPDGLCYATFQLEDEVSFVAFVETDEEALERLSQLQAFQRYRRTLDERCDVPPAVTKLREVGSFRFHGGG
jgi:quinol monooxygenase YgiN